MDQRATQLTCSLLLHLWRAAFFLCARDERKGFLIQQVEFLTEQLELSRWPRQGEAPAASRAACMIVVTRGAVCVNQDS